MRLAIPDVRVISAQPEMISRYTGTLDAVYLPRVSAAVACLFLLLLPFRLWQCQSASVKVVPRRYGVSKLAIPVIFAIGQILLLVAACLRPDTDISTLSSFVASAIAGPGVIWLSYLVYQRSCRPSDTLAVYILGSMACDVVWLTIPSLQPALHGLRVLVSIRLFLGFVLLISESRGKDYILLEEYQTLPPEERSGILGRTFFWWINPVLAKGYGGLLDDTVIPGLRRALSSAYLREKIVERWNAAKGDPLILTLVRCLRGPFIGATFPRLCVVGFKCSQPVLINHAIRYVQNPVMVGDDGRMEGYTLVLAAVVVYVGLALSTATYRHGLDNLRVMVRGSLTSLIHERSLRQRREGYDDAVTVGLVSTDVGALEDVAQMFHETWGHVAEVVIGTYLLSRQVGWLWTLPLVLVFLASRTSRYVAQHLKARQTGWNAATQKRLAVTSVMLGRIKDVKMLGMQDATEAHILELREREMAAARKVRWMMVIYNASANALGLFAPVITIVLYAVLAIRRGSALDTETAFTTVAILAMVTHPANMIMTIVPRAVAAYASFERIQAYLSGHEKDGPQRPTKIDTVGWPVVSVEKLCVSRDEDSAGNTLQDVSFDLAKGSVTICSGPVGGGKTTLARAILGEVSPTAGAVTVDATRVGYCSQTPWLPSKTIKEVIAGQSGEALDQAWYTRVVQACCLNQDLDSLPDGHDTLVGTLGTNLSGGQRQRVALARAVYQRCRLLVLDDTFSALDGRTEEHVIKNLLSLEHPHGLLRELGTTVFWITNSEHHFYLADSVIILDKTILQQGLWDTLSRKANISKLIFHDSEEQQKTSEQQAATAVSAKKPLRTKTRDDPTRKTGDISLYAYYFTSAGPLSVLLMVLCTASFSFFNTIPHYWLKLWTASPSPAQQAPFYITVYALLALAAWVTTNGIMSSSSLLIAPTSGVTLHRRLLHTIMGAPLAYFSSSSCSPDESQGPPPPPPPPSSSSSSSAATALNRFTEDIQLVDKQLAGATHSLSVQVFKLLAQAGVLLAVQPALALSLPLVAAAVYVVQGVYLATSRRLRIAEIESRAAVAASLLDTVRGVETVRAFGWAAAAAGENVGALDASQAPLYLLLCLQRWLSVVLDLVVAAVAIGTIAVSVAFRGTTTGGAVGVALNVIIVANATLLSLVSNWTNLEISLGAVARLREVEKDTPREEEDGQEEGVGIGRDWPSEGTLVMENVTAAYRPDAVAFRNVSLTFEPGQVVLLCGRTGSGKSSLILSLLRLIDTPHGMITLDGVDIENVSRSVLRQRCFITVTQDPFFLPDAALRFNLDPSAALADESIISALENTSLWSHFFGTSSSDPTDGHVVALLDKPLSTLPVLSGGQAQLLALTRAILQLKALDEPRGYRDHEASVKPVILLDEITSSLDAATEEKVYDLVQDEFVRTGHTVVMVTHKVRSYARRLRLGKDKVVWMKDGEVEKVEEAGNLQARLEE